MTTKPPGDSETHDSGQTQEWEHRRRQVIAMAATVFREKGYERGTTKEIGGRLGMSQPAVYYYVGSKPVLMAEIGHVVANDLTAALDAAFESSSDPVQQLRAAIENFTIVALNNLDVFATYWNEQKHIPADAAKAVEASEATFISRITELVVEAQRAGALPLRNASVTARGIIGMVYATYRWYQPDGELQPGEIASVFIDTLGLSASPG